MESLYRKYRPLTFESVVGQQHIVSTLEHAVTEGRLSHAYLFCGPRGTGKTTMARILAKALLCQGAEAARANGASGCMPDGTCPECAAIAEGTHPDVYELDAASRTGVDNVREEIINSVGFAPVRGSYKVYIIDEVHMLTTAAFNALLKTLEEPPAHVVFVLCTTDPQKLLETILSRCQRFDFHRIANEDLVARMRYICEQEGFAFDEEALEIVAKHARGGMRDALSTLEQLSVFGDGAVRVADARSLLGEVASSVLADFARNIAARDTPALFGLVRTQVDEGNDLLELTRDLVGHMRDVYTAAIAGNRGELFDGTPDEVRDLVGEARLFESTDRLARTLTVLDDAALEMRNASDPRLVFEIALTRLARPESDLTLEALAERIARLEAQIASGVSSTPMDAAQLVAPQTTPVPAAGASGAHAHPAPAPVGGGVVVGAAGSADSATVRPGTSQADAFSGPKPHAAGASGGPAAASRGDAGASTPATDAAASAAVAPSAPAEPPTSAAPVTSPSAAASAGDEAPAARGNGSASMPANTPPSPAAPVTPAASRAEVTQQTAPVTAASDANRSSGASRPAASPAVPAPAATAAPMPAPTPAASAAGASTSAPASAVAAATKTPTPAAAPTTSDSSAGTTIPDTTGAMAACAETPAVGDPGELQRKWAEVVRRVIAVKPPRGALLQSARAQSDDGSTLTVAFPAGSTFAIKMVSRPDSQNVILPVICEVYGKRTVSYVMDGGAAPTGGAASTAASSTAPVSAGQPASATPAASAVQGAPAVSAASATSARSSDAPAVSAAVPGASATPTNRVAASVPSVAPVASVDEAGASGAPSSAASSAPASPSPAADAAAAPSAAPSTSSLTPAASPASPADVDTQSGPTIVPEPDVDAQRKAWEDEQVPYDDATIASYEDEEMPPFDVPGMAPSPAPRSAAPAPIPGVSPSSAGAAPAERASASAGAPFLESGPFGHATPTMEIPQTADEAKALLGDIFGEGVVFKEVE